MDIGGGGNEGEDEVDDLGWNWMSKRAEMAGLGLEEL